MPVSHENSIFIQLSIQFSTSALLSSISQLFEELLLENETDFSRLTKEPMIKFLKLEALDFTQSLKMKNNCFVILFLATNF